MPLSRRTALAATVGLVAVARPRDASAQTTPAAPPPPAPGTDPAMSERALGNPGAKVVVQEFFSLTCTHCADFQRNTFPTVRKDLIDTGKIRYVWHDYPLDQVALMAAMVARSLPPDRYEPFITTLFATQDRWAFARGVNSTEELAKYAALAGMGRPAFDAAINNATLRQDILSVQAEAEKKYSINSTPSFLFNAKMVAGAIAYPTFQQNVDAAAV